MLTSLNRLPLRAPQSYCFARRRTASGRAQRASARNQNGAAPAVPLESTSSADGPVLFHPGPSPMETDSLTGIPDDEPALSRSNSSLNLHDLPAHMSHGRVKRKDKGKGKEVEPAPVKVKEEPKNILLPSPDPPSNLVCSLSLAQRSDSFPFPSSTTMITVLLVARTVISCIAMDVLGLSISGVSIRPSRV